jgi:ribosome production factor 2
MSFCGALFDVHPRYQHFKGLMMDFFAGKTVESMEVDGLQHVICFSVGEQQPQSYDSSAREDHPPIKFRVYLIQSKKVAGSKVPRIELEEMGPRMDLKLGRFQEASEEMMSMALKKPKETVVFISTMGVSLICRSRPRRMLRLILLGTNWAGFMLELKI